MAVFVAVAVAVDVAVAVGDAVTVTGTYIGVLVGPGVAVIIIGVPGVDVITCGVWVGPSVAVTITTSLVCVGTNVGGAITSSSYCGITGTNDQKPGIDDGVLVPPPCPSAGALKNSIARNAAVKIITTTMNAMNLSCVVNLINHSLDPHWLQHLRVLPA